MSSNHRCSDDGRVSTNLLIFDDEGEVNHRLSVQQLGLVGQHLTFSLDVNFSIPTVLLIQTDWSMTGICMLDLEVSGYVPIQVFPYFLLNTLLERTG